MINLTTAINQQVRLEGTAMDAHAGAVLLLANDQVVYLDGLASWDESMIGQELSISGVLRLRKLGPEPEVDAEGRVSHGISGTQYVLEAASWVRK